MIIGGSYFVGFVSEVQRGLNDPESASRQAVEKIASIEQILGYQGYLKAYRSFRLTGDITAREQMSQRAMDASRGLDALRKLYAETPAANRTLQDLAGVIEEFARVARSAPDLGPALRGSASMDALETLPQVPQLEATYLTLRTALERLRSQTQSHQMGSIAWALTWSQMLIICAFAAVICGLMAAAGLLQLGITQPLKSLAGSLDAVGDGHVNRPVWGTDRTDEIGTMARAGEKLRKSLTETETLKTLAEKGEVHLRLEGDASILLGKVVSGVESAAEALKNAAAELTASQTMQQRAFEQSAQKFDEFGPRFNELATTVGQVARDVLSGAATDLRTSMSKIVTMADERTARLSDVAGQFEQNGRQLSEAVDLVKVKTGTAIDGLTNSITAFRKAADGAQSIQGAFFTACDRISSDAAATTENVRTLAERLNTVVETVDGQLQGKLAALGNLEQGIERTLGAIEGRARETTEAIAAAAAAMETRTARSEERTEQSIGEFEDIVKLFKDEHAETIKSFDHQAFASMLEQLNQVATRLQERLDQGNGTATHIEALTRAFARKIDLSLGNLNSQATQFAEAFNATAAAVEKRTTVAEQSVGRSLDDFREVIDIFRTGASAASASPVQATVTQESFEPFARQIEALRNDIRELALRMTEERILMTAEMPASSLPPENHLAPSRPQRSLADVPADEILNRLKELAAEMSSGGTATTTQPGTLTEALEAFARSIRPLYAAKDPVAGLNQMVPELVRHAQNIDESAREVAHAAALRNELGAITSELRALTQAAQAPALHAGDDLRETALHLGARAESLFSYLNQMHPDDFAPPRPATASRMTTMVSSSVDTTSLEQTVDDLEKLARIINTLEERTTGLSDQAVASNMDHQTGAASPTEEAHLPSGRQGEQAIAAVYESIERLNNIAAALARAGDAERLRTAAG